MKLRLVGLEVSSFLRLVTSLGSGDLNVADGLLEGFSVCAWNVLVARAMLQPVRRLLPA